MLGLLLFFLLPILVKTNTIIHVDVMAKTGVRHKLRRKSQRQTYKADCVDVTILAHYLIGPIHAYVIDFCTDCTAYKLYELTQLEKRLVDCVIAELLRFKLLVKSGLILNKASYTVAAIRNVFGHRDSAKFISWSTVGCSKSKGRRYKKRQTTR